MKIALYILLPVILLSAGSCKKWLDVDPRSVVKEKEMFEDVQGFRTALMGVYTKMASRDLYGANLTIGFIDVLAQYYSIESNQHSFFNYSSYDYEVARGIPDAVWKNGYAVIANCNNILENIEKKRSLFKNGEYDLIRAEATAVRAYMHFDLLRLFAPSYTVNPSAPAIPYVDRISHIPFKQLTVAQVLTAVMKDVQQAADLLRTVDPLSPDYNGAAGAVAEVPQFFTFRQERMNYYAVLGALARASLYGDDKTKAAGFAAKVLERGSATPVFTLYTDKSWDNSDLYFNSEAPALSKLTVPEGRKYEFYETALYGSVDTRYKDWFRYYPGSNEEFMSKYMRSIPQNGNPPNMILMRPEEMNYILAECASSEEEAVKQLNLVRNRYGLSKVNDLAAGVHNVEDETAKEYRKMFIGEGQLFFYYKRKNTDPIPYSLTEDVQKAYVLPVPDVEVEFGNIQN